MKTRLCASVVIVILCAACLGHAAPARPDRWALLVGSGESSDRTIQRLYGTPTDLRLMASLLTTKFGFPKDHICIIGLQRDACGPGFDYREPQAKRRAILQGFQWLVDQSDSDDYVVFYYSGHGTTVLDYSGDEAFARDQAIVPFEGRPFAIRDDVIAGWMKRIRARQITEIIDSCYSGDMARSTAAFGRSKFVPPPESELAASLPRAIRAEEMPPPRVRLLAASQGNQDAEEVDLAERMSVSSFTWELYQSLLWCEGSQVEGEQVIAKVGARLAARHRRQRPVWLAAAEDRSIIAPIPLYARHASVAVQGTDPRTLRLPVGRLAGIREGTRFKDANARISGYSYARSVVQARNVDWFDSDARLVDTSKRPPSAVVLAAPTGPSPQRALRIALRKKGNDAALPGLQSAWAGLAVAESGSGPADLCLDLDRDTGHIVVIEPDETRHDLGEANGDAAARLRAFLQSSRLQSNVAALDGPVHPLGLSLSMRSGDHRSYQKGEQFEVVISSTASCSVLLLDVNPAGEVRVLRPDSEQSDLPAGPPWSLFPSQPLAVRLEACEPFGEDVFLAIATSNPVDWNASLGGIGADGQAMARSVASEQCAEITDTVGKLLSWSADALDSARGGASSGVDADPGLVDIATLRVRTVAN